MFKIFYLLLEVLVIIVPVLLAVAFMTIIERKALASFQRRVGPNTILSRQINKLRKFSTISDSNLPQDINLLNPYLITGFVDAEGSFMVLILREPKSKTGWTVKPRFSIGLHEKDLGILENIKSSLENIGQISKQGKISIQYRVSSLESITNILIPHFDKYPLITKKKADFILFKKAVELINNKEHLSINGLKKIVAIKASLNLGLSDELKTAFPKIKPIKRPIIKSNKIQDPNWLAGFSSGEGCFNVRFKKLTSSSLNLQTLLTFKIVQHSRDTELLESFIKYLECGYVFKGQNLVQYIINKNSDLFETLIPFFDKYKIIGVKYQDYLDFKRVVELVKKKDNLTVAGLEEIKKIKEGMNKGRN